MTTFLIAIASLLVFALLIVWGSFIRGKKTEQHALGNIRKETNVSLYHEHLTELDRDLAEGSIQQQSYQQLKMELDKTLLQDVQNSVTASQKSTQLSVAWPLLLSVFIISLSSYFYLKLGTYQYLDKHVSAEAVDPHANLDMNQQSLFRVQQLQQKVATEPTNSQAWFSLGQAFISVGQFDDAVVAFDQVISLIGEYAELIGPKAQALYYKNNEQINDEIQTLIEKALVLDPLDSSTNILLGMNFYARSEFSLAIEHWQKVLDSGRPGINRQALIGAVTEAQRQLEVSNVMSNGNQPSMEQKVNKGPKLTIEVSLSEAIFNTLSTGEDKVVFVYATAASGPRMPLAAVKIFASELPTTITLDDSLAMSPQMKLSSVDKVNIYAVVSIQGNVGIKAGDFKAEQLNVSAKHQENIKLTIDTVVTQ
jgi:cytochrome c-type biogenesis protein CcmH